MCQHRRGVLTAYSSLWTHLEFEDVGKMARAWVERSKSSPLEIALYGFGASDDFLKDAFLLAIPHISRVMSISIVGDEDPFQEFTMHFPRFSDT